MQWLGGLNLLDPHNWTEEDEISSMLPFFDTLFLSHTVDGSEIPKQPPDVCET